MMDLLSNHDELTPNLIKQISPWITKKFGLSKKSVIEILSLTSCSWEQFQKMALWMSTIYDISPAVTICQAAHETGGGTSNFAKTRNNYFGLNAIDSDPNKAFKFKKPADSIIFYCNLISNPKYKYYPAYQERSDPDLMLKMIVKAGYATSPTYIDDLKRNWAFLWNKYVNFPMGDPARR